MSMCNQQAHPSIKDLLDTYYLEQLVRTTHGPQENKTEMVLSVWRLQFSGKRDIL